VGEIVPFPVYIIPFPVSENHFEIIRPNGETFVKEVF
jgi:hypothetical protein